MQQIINYIKIICLVLSIYASGAYANTCAENSEYYDTKLELVLDFMPGKKKCLEYTSDGKTYYYYRDLKEFTIKKTGRHCLWGSKSWDEECQDVSMKYAYGDYGRTTEDAEELKKVVIDFIKHIQNNEIDKATKLTGNDAMFFTNDNANCIQETPTIHNENYPGCRSYFNKLHKDKTRYEDFNMDVFRENLMHIYTDNLKFFLNDSSQRMVYTIVVPFEYQNVKKEFLITFYFYIGHWGQTWCSKSIYDLIIVNQRSI